MAIKLKKSVFGQNIPYSIQIKITAYNTIRKSKEKTQIPRIALESPKKGLFPLGVLKNSKHIIENTQIMK